MRKYIILHNKHDEKSRQFVGSLPMFSLDRICVLDWYGDHRERWARSCLCHFMEPYFGPPPSAFPVIVTNNSEGVWGAIQSANHPDDRHDLSAYFFEAEHGSCLGGKWLEGIPDSIKSVQEDDPTLAKIIESVYKKHVKEMKSVHAELLTSL